MTIDTPIEYAELVDIPKLQALLESFHRVIGIANAVIDTDGKVIAHAGWQRVCEDFHRVNAETCRRCIQSDTSLVRSMTEGASFAVYNCLNGLVDTAAPIVVGGQHVANVFTGQFLAEPPDMAFFRDQARRFGFDETAYLEAIARVPVIPRERVEAVTRLYAQLAATLADSGMDRLAGMQAKDELLRANRGLEARVAARTEALSVSEERLRLALSAAGEGWFDLDLKTGQAVAAPEYFSLLGYEPYELDTSLQSWLEGIHPEDRPAAAAAFAASLERRETTELTYRRRNKAGEWLWLSSIGKVVQWDSEGHPLRMLGVHMDITARKRAETELAEYRHRLEDMVEERTAALSRAKEAAEAASRAKSAFLANMSHELRTPMNAIIGMTDLALREVADPALRDRLGKIAQASHHLLSVINDILDISKIEAERLQLEQTRFRLGDVLEDLLNLVGQKAAEKGLRLRPDLDPRVAGLALWGDPTRLGQILVNFVGNAVKFTHEGEVVVRARVAEEGPRDARLRFEIQDTGIGISDEDQGRLFTPFEQADGSMSRKYGGTGLGLAISKRLAELMGGQVGVESSVGRGSTFWLAVRLDKAMEAPSAATETLGSSEERLRCDYAGARLLLVEDEPISREVARELLEYAGLEVAMAEDGLQAVEMARQGSYDLIMMDMQMPRLNGVEATKAIRRLPGHDRVPIVAMTANAFDEDRQVCLEAGMNDHIPKPIDPERLFQSLLRWLDWRRGFAEQRSCG